MIRFLIASFLLAAFLLTATGCDVKTPPPPTGQLPLPDPPVGAGVPGGDQAKEKPKTGTAQ